MRLESTTRHRAFSLRTLLLAVGLIAGVIALISWYYNKTYPYGRTHACDSQLSFALQEYAAKHKGQFPAGEKSPEASLSLLHGANRTDPALLAGKTASAKYAETLLSSGKLLDPSTCSWHYVEGLRLTDNPKLALFWDKIGLGHNGDWIEAGGHTVNFISCDRRWISVAEWPSLLEEQKMLLPNRPGLTAAVLSKVINDGCIAW